MDTTGNPKLEHLQMAIDEGLENGVSDKSVNDIMKQVEGKLRADGHI